MKSSTFPSYCFAAIACLSATAALAQDPSTQPQLSPAAQARFEELIARVRELEKKHTITVNGSDNPAGLPRGAVYRMLLPRGPIDDASFAQFALERYGATGADTEVLKEARDVRPKAFVDICVRVLDGSLPDGGSIAKYLAQVNDDEERDSAERYQGILDRLSPRVRANVLRKMDEDVAGISSSNLDHLGMAQEDPEIYKAMVTARCRGKQVIAASPRDSALDVTGQDEFGSSSIQGGVEAVR